MIKYAIIIDEKTGLCDVGLGDDINYYQSIGMTEQDVDQSDIDFNWYLSKKCPRKSKEQKIKEREEEFNKEFFLTSLGYIRRKVTMKTGEVKDFLSGFFARRFFPPVKNSIMLPRT